MSAKRLPAKTAVPERVDAVIVPAEVLERRRAERAGALRRRGALRGSVLDERHTDQGADRAAPVATTPLNRL